MAAEMIANLEQAMSSNGSISAQPHRSARETQTANKAREEELPATPKKPKPMRLAQAKHAKTTAQLEISSVASSSTQPAPIIPALVEVEGNTINLYKNFFETF